MTSDLIHWFVFLQKSLFYGINWKDQFSSLTISETLGDNKDIQNLSSNRNNNILDTLFYKN